MSTNTDLDFDFYKENLDKFVKEHNGKYVVIKNQEVLGFYVTEVDALKETVKNHELGSFIVQKCVPLEQSTQEFHSRVIFTQ